MRNYLQTLKIPNLNYERQTFKNVVFGANLRYLNENPGVLTAGRGEHGSLNFLKQTKNRLE
ncbi:unnamed protein product [Acanthoscelides obtectus]|uniref:Uncharacterized protein n=1 Tax=Acanthoscelides obtectus TaxID=200917 RepID=A0A9P0M844_ACAOB|nr:unnamed protein product [Acanthoscelides obtectus]CAK1645205.1 hypothetical protein AOBTE_LOCUS14057 [Acanthoscelides obtectus]